MNRTVFVFIACLITTPLLAHHSRAPFDMDRIQAFEGTVIRYQWRNPHVYLTVRDASDREWLIETDATPVMQRSGWSRDSFSVGDTVSVRLRPDKNAAKAHGLLVSVAGADGKPMASMNRGTNTGIEFTGEVATSLAGVWSGERLKSFGSFRDFSNLPLTTAGAAARDRYDPSQNPVARCIPWPAPFFMLANGLYLTEVELEDDSAIIRNEFYGMERIIYLDGREHPAEGKRTNQGHSIGHWEGGTLIIDTTLFADHRTPIPNSGIPSGPRKHVTERLTLSDDGETVLVEFVLEDPDYLAESLSGQVTWHYAPHLELINIACEPDIARQYLK
jgi:hypothetical protein